MKTCFTIIIGFLTTIIFAQKSTEQFLIEKGTWTIEGELSLNFDSIENTNNFDDNTSVATTDIFGFYIAPKIGYTINDNLILGLGLGYGYSDGDSSFNDDSGTSEIFSKNNTYDIFPYVKKLFPLGQKFAFHVQGEFRYRYRVGSVHSGAGERENRNHDFLVGIRPGFNFLLSETILLQANFGFLGYQHFSGEVDDILRSTRNEFTLDLSTETLLFGLVILI